MNRVLPLSVSCVLSERARQQPDRVAYVFLRDGEDDEHRLTYGELDLYARCIAEKLRHTYPARSRALVMYPAGLDFIAAFFGCLYAGLLAIPVYPPRNNRSLSRLEAIVRDATPEVVLTTASLLTDARERFAGLRGAWNLNWIATDQGFEGNEVPSQTPSSDSHSVAFLQYTSGSTDNPKGVMVSQGNLVANCASLAELWGLTANSVSVSWTPAFHDLGLVGGIVAPLVQGYPSVLMPPTSFLQQPLRWLSAITKYRGTYSAAPNFAYMLCVEKLRSSELSELDLSCWNHAVVGAEPVREQTMKEFSQVFACCGFRQDSFKPGYGLAESTLAVTTCRPGQPYVVKHLVKKDLEQHRVTLSTKPNTDTISVVGCGKGPIGQRLRIVNPDSLKCCKPDEIGEIWVSSPSVAKGYWGRPDLSRETFSAYLSPPHQGPYLRTGDLGFMIDDQLFVTGRRKDLLILRGMNHYPQDIERTVETCHKDVRTGCCAAFSVDANNRERAVVVQELQRHSIIDRHELINTIKHRVTEEHQITLYAVVLIRAHSIPKTSSGKIQRQACKKAFLNGSLVEEARWEEQAMAPKLQGSHQEKSPETTAAGLKDWLLQQTSKRLRVCINELRSDQVLSYYGLDSVGAVTLVGDLEIHLGRSLPSSLLFDYPTIDHVVDHLCKVPSPTRASFNKPSYGSHAIAVIGMSCRFPHAPNLQCFWENLQRSHDAISNQLGHRWSSDQNDRGLHSCEKADEIMPWAGLIEDVDRWDAGFFETSYREAASMDPQQRLVMEVAWEALEHAGHMPGGRLSSETGIFIGASGFDHVLETFMGSSDPGAYGATGSSHSLLANRLSYFLGVQGPSLAVDTACSSSLVAVHLACESLRRGECPTALAGGINLLLAPELFKTLNHAHMLSPDGRCKTFDSRANGYVRGEGCGVVVLKRLEDALTSGDSVCAIILGSAVNQDGRSNGLTAPNGPAQEAVIRKALCKADVAPNQVQFVECHGTGTPLGDPQEVQALHHVLGEGRSDDQPCYLGSVKTNIGHLEAAAGVAGLIKTILALQGGQIPPNLHLQNINPRLSMETIPFELPMRPMPWPTVEGRRIAGVSSFGFGGTNAHLILSDAPVHRDRTTPSKRDHHVVCLSAKSELALRQLAELWKVHLDKDPSEDLEDLSFSANVGRSHFSHRLAIVSTGTVGLSHKLNQVLQDGSSKEIFHHHVSSQDPPPKIAFLFPGSEYDYVEMARELVRSEPRFERLLETYFEKIKKQINRNPWSLLQCKDNRQNPNVDPLDSWLFLVTVEIALAKLWEAWGIAPSAVLGHGVGEIAAACVAGAFSFEESIRLVAEAAQRVQPLKGNQRVIVVHATAAHVLKRIEEGSFDLSIKAVNSPIHTVVQGDVADVESFLSHLKEQGITFHATSRAQPDAIPRIRPGRTGSQRNTKALTYSEPRLLWLSSALGAPFVEGTPLSQDF